MLAMSCDLRNPHVAMPIEGLDPRQKLVVVAHIDQHLCVVLDALPTRVAETEGDIRRPPDTCGSEFMVGYHVDCQHKTVPKQRAQMLFPTATAFSRACG